MRFRQTKIAPTRGVKGTGESVTTEREHHYYTLRELDSILREGPFRARRYGDSPSPSSTWGAPFRLTFPAPDGKGFTGFHLWAASC
jgi:hypothetical protein